MDPRHRAWIGASVLALAGAVLVWWGQLAASIPLFAAAGATLLLVIEPSVPPELPAQANEGNERSMARLAASFELLGRGVHIPPGDGRRRAGLFLPARDPERDEIPPVDEKLVIHRGRPGVLGLSVAPPGRGLETAWHALEGLPEGQGVEEAADHIRRALARLGLARDIRVARAGAHVRVAYTHQVFAATCERGRSELAPWDVQGGCPVCSFIALLVAWGTREPVAYRGCKGQGTAKVELELEVLR